MDTTERTQTHRNISFIFLCHFPACVTFALSSTKLSSVRFSSLELKLMIVSELLPFSDHLLLLDVSPQLSRPSAAPGSALETFVGEDVNTMLIVNLLSGTEYSVKVIASYTTGSSDALSGRAKTCKSILCSFNLTALIWCCLSLRILSLLQKNANSSHLCWSPIIIELQLNINAN